MAKLTLDVDQLEVQSFATSNERGDVGTVEGYDSGRTPSLTRNDSCPGFPCTAYDTCADTCDNFTCVQDTCDYTCHTNICACEISDFGTCFC